MRIVIASDNGVYVHTDDIAVLLREASIQSAVRNDLQVTKAFNELADSFDDVHKKIMDSINGTDNTSTTGRPD